MTPAEDGEHESRITQLDDARGKLIRALAEVHKHWESSADDWRYRLLHTIREYCRAIGIQRELIEPVQALLFETAESAVNERRRQAGERTPHLPLNEASCLAMAAAVITELRERGESDNISAAVQTVARRSGIDRKRLKNLRDNINRGVASAEVVGSYQAILAKVQTWTTAEMLGALDAMRGFVS
jgi:hypothetical protein